MEVGQRELGVLQAREILRALEIEGRDVPVLPLRVGPSERGLPDLARPQDRNHAIAGEEALQCRQLSLAIDHHAEFYLDNSK